MIPVRQGSERTYVDGPFRLRKVNEVLAFCDDSLVCFSQSRCFEHLAHCFNNNNNNNKYLVKIHNKRYRESKGLRIMKIALIIYNYYIKPNKTLDIYIVKLPSCIETLFY